ncbi:MAG: L-threonylcarbamoyladenylate synthase [Candidatus Parcubacteria bacterium]|nr:L-threonylcarbamoyladenylate synthase [Candidatus Parcubacteria bacterium]
MIIKVKVFPKSKKESVIQKQTDLFEVRVKVEAKQGEANNAVINILADFFNVNVKSINMIKGGKSKNKVFEIKGIKNQIEIAVEILKKGGVIAYPTDTVYGIGCHIFNNKAIERILELKKRDKNNSLLVAVSDFEMMSDIAVFTEKERKFMGKFLPGPIAFILPKKSNISDLVTGKRNTLGVRIPDNKETLAIIKQAGFPIITTSANISGQKPIIMGKDIDLKVDFVVEGKCKYKKPSTIVDLINKKILRQGQWAERVEQLLNTEDSL